MARFFNPIPQFLDGAARVYPNAKLYFYENGTTTPKDTFADAALTTPNPNPVLCDGQGRVPPIFLPDDGVYSISFTNQNDVQFAQVDDYTGADSSVSPQEVIAALSANTGSVVINGSRVEINPETTFKDRVLVDDTTQATNATDGSLQTDGGLSVTKQSYFGAHTILANNNYHYGALTGGSTSKMIGMNTSDLIEIDGQGRGATFGGTLSLSAAGARINFSAGNGYIGAADINWGILFRPDDSVGGTHNYGFLDSSNAVLVTITESNGDLNLAGGGNLIVSSGKGIDFSATSDGSGTATSELLDDYEEGTWTPVLDFSGGTTGITYTTQVGRYTKIGNIVHATCFIILSSKGSASGNAQVSGFPYAAASPGCAYIANLYAVNISNNSDPLIQMNNSASNVTLVQTNTAGTASNLTNANFANNSSPRFTLTYEAA